MQAKQPSPGIARLAALHGYSVSDENGIMTIKRVQTKNPGNLLILGGIIGLVIGILIRIFVVRIVGTVVVSTSVVALVSGVKMNNEDKITRDRIIKFSEDRISVRDEGDRIPRHFEKANIDSFDYRVNRYDKGQTVSVVMRLHDGNNLTLMQLGREQKSEMTTDAKRLADLFNAQLAQ
ncbi:hypothetical protein [Lewinella sp. IMCC34191]|uniref:hypothetical protein n=1 Tax=Lewinella sp. IMCC34191 TaxID=2259172 RepID=UPI000E26C9C2|nr:hypothetical protein [Lewinella sp. IMCC34191]